MDRIKELTQELQTAVGKEKVITMNKLAFAYYHSDPVKTKELAEEALELATQQNFQLGIATAYNNIGVYKHVTGDFEEAKKYYIKAAGEFEDAGDIGKVAGAKNNIGAILEKQANYKMALKFYYEVLKIVEELKIDRMKALVYNNIGIIYEKQDSYHTALDYHKKSLKIKLDIDDTLGASTSYNNIGVIYRNLKDYNLALENFEKALELKETAGDERAIAVTHVNIGSILHERNKNSEALKYFLDALNVFNKMSDKYGIVTCCTSIGMIYSEENNFEEAFEYLHRSIKISKEIGAAGLQTKAMLAISKIYESKKDFAKALKFYIEYTELSNEQFNEQKSKQITEMQTRYETEKKEKEAEIFKLRNVELAEANSNLKLEITERKKAETEIKKSREMLQIINKILRHDLANDFTVIKSAVNLFIKKSDKTMLDEISKRADKSLNTIEKYRKYESFLDSNSDLQEIEISKILNEVIKEFPEIKFNVSGKSVVYADEALNSVFRNLINNAEKHGSATEISVDVTSKNNKCSIHFTNNGKKIPEKIKDQIFNKGFFYGNKGNTGIGLNIVQQAIERFDGSINLKENELGEVGFEIELRNVLK